MAVEVAAQDGANWLEDAAVGIARGAGLEVERFEADREYWQALSISREWMGATS